MLLMSFALVDRQAQESESNPDNPVGDSAIRTLGSGSNSRIDAKAETSRPTDPSARSSRTESAPDPLEPELDSGAEPIRIRIERAGVDAQITELGVKEDGTLEAPSNFAAAGYFSGRAIPGDIGPAVVVGHLDSATGPAAFYGLRNLEIGDLVSIDRSDGVTARYSITEILQVDKPGFPTDRVYGKTSGPELRLVTCDGRFDPKARSYQDNLVLFADHVENVRTDYDA